MRIAIVTDAWAPQTNGVVRTLQSVIAEVESLGHQVGVVSPDRFANVPCPTYPGIRLALPRPGGVGEAISALAPDAVHIATEGPLGVTARRWCLRHNMPFTTAFHTQFPDYIAQRTGLPAEWFWHYIRWFHAPAERVLASTESVRQGLRAHGVPHVAHWGRGVDLELFTPDAPPPALFADLPRPIMLNVGRVAVEKNLEAFLDLDVAGSKVIVGDGPNRAALEKRYPDAHFLGALSGRDLAGAYAGADVFVFPSRTDTFGLVMIEALACGTPVAGFPVMGPIDVVSETCGALSDDLAQAVGQALAKEPDACIAHARTFTWEASAQQFLSALCTMPRRAVAA